MRSRTPKLIDPSCVDVGDEVVAHTVDMDTEVAVKGTVARIDFDGARRVFRSGSGAPIFIWLKHDKDQKLKIELLRKYVPNTDQPLFDL